MSNRQLPRKDIKNQLPVDSTPIRVRESPVEIGDRA